MRGGREGVELVLVVEVEVEVVRAFTHDGSPGVGGFEDRT
jgi:hypothetical protein